MNNFQDSLRKILNIILLAAILVYGISFGEENKTLSSHLKPFDTYIGKTFKGKFPTSTSSHPMLDVLHWERALNGNAVRIVHSVNNGEYGGETIIMWDPKAGRLSSWYFTTGGNYTQSTIDIEKDSLIFIEDVSGNNNGITKVKTIIQTLYGGKLQSRSKFLMNDVWVNGHEVIYQEEPNAQVIFK